MKKGTKIIYYATTFSISVALLLGVLFYFIQPETHMEYIAFAGFPTWLLYPLGIAKFLGFLALWIKRVPKLLREWAYAGIFFNIALITVANFMNDYSGSIGDIHGYYFTSFILTLIVISRFTLYEIEKKYEQEN